MQRIIILVICVVVAIGAVFFVGTKYGKYGEKLNIIDRIEEVDNSRKATDAKVAKYTDSERCRIAGGKLSVHGNCE